MMKRSLGQTFFVVVAIFGTNLRGPFVQNVKKSPKSTHPTVYPHAYEKAGFGSGS
jgi:hypothetical protein